MTSSDLKKFNLFISGSLTAAFGAAINIVPSLNYRLILNPLSILLSFLISVYIIHRIKCYSNNLLIENNENEIKEIEVLIQRNGSNVKLDKQIETYKKENYNLRRDNSLINLY